MKTGGTMNFLKRAGAILMLVAVFASSCNKYADDFKQINTKLDALATQVAGVTTLSTSLTALAGQVSALQTSVNGLPTTASIATLSASLKTVSDNVIAIQATLKTVADAGTANKLVVDKLAVDLAALAKTVGDNNTAMNLKLKGLADTDVLQSAQLTSLVAANVTILANIAALQTSLNGLALTGTSTDTATSLTIQGLQLMLNAQKAILDQLLANSNMYNGDVTITTGPELTFYAKKIAQLGIINGNLTINTTALSSKLDSVNFVVKNIGAVIGSQGGTKNWVNVTSTSTTTLLDLSRLVSVAGDYTVSGVDINDSNLSSVGGNFDVTYDGPYTYPSLTTVTGNLTLTEVPYVSGTTVGTTSISLPTVKVAGSVYDGSENGAGVLVYPEATSIALSGGVTSLTAKVATQITLGSTAYASGLGVSSSTTAVATVDLSAATSAAGAVSVTAFNGSTVKFTKLASAAGGVTVNTGTSGTVDFSALATAAGGVKLTGPATITFPVLVSGLLTSDATTVTLPKHEWAIPSVLSKVVTLTLGNVNAIVNLDSYNTTLVTASVSGKAQTTWTATTGGVVTTLSAKLATLTLGGNLASANLVGLTKLTSLTTSGNVNTFKVDGASLLVSMTLGHTYYQPGNIAYGGPGSDLVIKNNPLLTTLKPLVLDYPASIVITGNATLASIDLSSYKTKLLSAPGANTTITINSNALVGDYTNSVAITATTPYFETVIKSGDLAKLKDFIATYPATGVPTLTLAINLDKVTLGGVTGNATLASRMVADAAHTVTPGGASFNFGAPATGITIADEFKLVQ